MKESVSAIFICKSKIYIIKRQDHLRAFAGYFSFPGGKVDREDVFENSYGFDLSVDDRFINALRRELEEELAFNFNKVTKISLMGVAITPDFNPHRFKNYYFKVFVDEEIDFTPDLGEIEFGKWVDCKEAFNLYRSGQMLVVPPMISILEDLNRDINSHDEIDPNLKYDSVTEVPVINPVSGLFQYLPLSNTFPPANRTNSFFFGDDYKVLIDPSPANDAEFDKFITSLNNRGHRPDLVFLSHHHPDHHEYCIQTCEYFKIPIAMSKDTHQRLITKLGETYFKNLEIKFFKEGDTLTSSNGVEIKVIETPGHDEGQLSFLRVDNAWAIVTDLIQTIGTVVIGGDEGDMKKYFASLDRIIKINPISIFPSHGIGLGGIKKLKDTLSHRLEREQEVLELSTKNLDIHQMREIIYPELPERLHKYAAATIKSHLDKIHKYGAGL